MERESAWKKYAEADREAVEALAADYIDFISDNKTERECVAASIALAEAAGYRPLAEAVAEGRDLPVEEVRALATGMTFTGMDAVDNGLADEIGTLEDACDKAAALGGIGAGYRTMYLQPEVSDLSALLGLMGMETKAADDGLMAKEQDRDVRFEN